MKTRVLLLLLPFTFVASSALAVGPNILWIFSEDLSPYIGCYGDEVNEKGTPTIDQMAREGVLFKRAYATAPVCSASRSAIITGVYQTSTGTHQHRSSRGGDPVHKEVRIHLPSGVKTIPELLRDAGYFTFNSGKDDYNFHYDRRALYSVGTKKNYRVGQNGWQGNFAAHSGAFDKDTWNARPDKDQPWFGQIMIWGGKAGGRHVRQGQALTNDQVPLPPYFPKTQALHAAWTTHHNAVRGADKQIQDIIDLLKKDGELDNTVIFFFSDHGNNQSLRGKQFCYEDGVHVPLLVWGDSASVVPGTIRDELVSTLDISATTLSLAGVNLPTYLDGVDLFAPDFQARTAAVSARDRCDYTIDRIRTVRTDQFRYIKNYHTDRPLLQAQYRDHHPAVKDLKRLHDRGELSPELDTMWFGKRAKEELYLLSEDPHQMKNLAGDPAYAEELKRHRRQLNAWIQTTGDRGQRPEDANQLKATYDLWKNKDIFKKAKTNPEYDPFRN